MLYTKEQTAKLHEHTFAYWMVEKKDNALNLSLNRPHKKNALTPVMVNEMAFALAHAHHHPDVWLVTMSGQGDVFCAGADLKAFMGHTEPNSSTIPPPNAVPVIGDLFLGLHKPCIATVAAPVYAGGMLLLAGCTHVIATPKATFGLPEVKRGIWPMQVMQSLLQIMPARKVLDWCMRGNSISARQALELGLVTQLVDSEAAMAQACHELAEGIKAGSPSAIRMGLAAYAQLQSTPPDGAHAYLQQMLMQLLQTNDAREGINAFKEKRPPVWGGN